MLKINPYKKIIAILILFLGFFLFVGTEVYAQTSDCQQLGLTGAACCNNYPGDPQCKTTPPTTQSDCQQLGLSGAQCCASYADDPVCKGTAPSTTGPSTPASGTCGNGLKSVGGFCVPETTCSSGSVCGTTTLLDLISKVLKFLLGIAGVIAVVFVVIGGFLYMSSGGNEEQAEKGKKTLINFLIGLVVIILAYTIVNIVVGVLTTTK